MWWLGAKQEERREVGCGLMGVGSDRDAGVSPGAPGRDSGRVGSGVAEAVFGSRHDALVASGSKVVVAHKPHPMVVAAASGARSGERERACHQSLLAGD